MKIKIVTIPLDFGLLDKLRRELRVVAYVASGSRIVITVLF